MGLLTTRSRRWRSEDTRAPDPKEELNSKLWMLRLVVPRRVRGA